MKNILLIIIFSSFWAFQVEAQSIEGTYQSTTQTFVKWVFKKTTQEQTYTFIAYSDGKKNYHGYAYYSKSTNGLYMLAKGFNDPDNISFAHCEFDDKGFSVTTRYADGSIRWESTFRKLPD